MHLEILSMTSNVIGHTEGMKNNCSENLVNSLRNTYSSLLEIKITPIQYKSF